MIQRYQTGPLVRPIRYRRVCAIEYGARFGEAKMWSGMVVVPLDRTSLAMLRKEQGVNS
jgi:hypothetical protein